MSTDNQTVSPDVPAEDQTDVRNNPVEDRKTAPDTPDEDSSPQTGASGSDPAGAADSGTDDSGPDGQDEDMPRIPRSVIARMRRESEEVLSVTGERISDSRFESFSKNLVDLAASKRNKKILTDRMVGIETIGARLNALLSHGEFKILIPDLYMFDPKARGYEIPKEAAFANVIYGRLNSEIDYVVEEIDVENRIAVGNHLEACRRKQKAYYFDTRFDGRPMVNEGMIVEARVISVRRYGIFIDVFGCESFIPNQHLSYARIPDAREYYSNGDIVQVRVTKIEKISSSEVKVTASVKATYPDPRLEAMKIYHVDGLYRGRVTVIDEFGIFVTLGNGAECKCEYPKEKFPTVGATVSVRIIGKDEKEKLLWGVITRIISV